MNRWKAASTHLVLSILVIGTIALAAFLLWYPHGLYRVAGLDRILLVMLGIDLTAGPLLTLIVYKAGKPSLKFDLACIALAQLAFLGYGLHTLQAGRPVFLVGTPETFTVVFASEISATDLAKATKPEWRRLSWTGPQLVGTRMPSDRVQREAVIEDFMAGGAGIERSPQYYVDFASVAPDILRASTAVDASDGVRQVQPSADEGPRTHRQFPIASRRGAGIMRIDPVTAAPITTLATSDRL